MAVFFVMRLVDGAPHEQRQLLTQKNLMDAFIKYFRYII